MDAVVINSGPGIVSHALDEAGIRTIGFHACSEQDMQAMRANHPDVSPGVRCANLVWIVVPGIGASSMDVYAEYLKARKYAGIGVVIESARNPTWVFDDHGIKCSAVKINSSKVGGNTTRERWYTWVPNKKRDMVDLRAALEAHNGGKVKPAARFIDLSLDVKKALGDRTMKAVKAAISRWNQGIVSLNQYRSQRRVTDVHPSLSEGYGHLYAYNGGARVATLDEYRALAGVPKKFALVGNRKNQTRQLVHSGDYASSKWVAKQLAVNVK